MTEYPKERCEKCGEMVTTFLPARAKHMKNCKGPKDYEPKPVVTLTEADVGEPDKPAATKPQDAESKKAQTKLQIEKAYAKQKAMRQVAAIERARKSAPDAVVGMAISGDKLTATIKMLREQGRIPADYTTYWGEDVDHAHNLHAGYEPVEDLEGRQPRIKEMELWMRPKAVSDAQVAADEESSRKQFHTAAVVGGVQSNKKEDHNKPAPERFLGGDGE